MKNNKIKFGLIFLIFIIILGIFAQTEGVYMNTGKEKVSLESLTPSKPVETSSETKENVVQYERNKWELDAISQRSSSPKVPIKEIDTVRYSVGATQYVSSPNINIDGNAEFHAYSFPGNGTESQPYVIENLNITNNGFHLIYIRNTDLFFEIRNNHLNGINQSYNAIFLLNVSNGLVLRNIVFNVEIGVHLDRAHGNEIIWNDIFDTSYDAVNVWSSNNITINFNTIWNVGENGFSNGISVSDSCNSTWIEGNAINNVGGWAGIYLGFSSLSTVRNNYISNIFDGNGITIGYWGTNPKNTYATVNNNTIYYSRYRGIRVECANANTITKNLIFQNNEDGIQLYSSSDNFFEHNEIIENAWDGILIDAFSQNNQFYSNILDNNSVGIYNYNSSNNEFFGNGIYNSRAEGIVIALSNNIDISFNDILSAWGSGIYSWGTNNNFYIANNTLSSNSRATLTNPELWGSGIHVSDFTGIIAGNIITNNHYSGIYVEVGSGAQIYGNEILSNGFTGVSIVNVSETAVGDNRINDNGGNGVFCLYSDSNTIAVNTIIRNKANGIFLIDSNFNLIENNEIANNSGTIANPLPPGIKFSIQASTNGHGVFLDPCIGNIIKSNQIYGNAGSGAYLLYSSGNDLTDNSFTDNNENGVFLEGSSGNKILRNYIASNGDPDLLYMITKGDLSFKIEASTNGHGVFLDPTSINVVSENIIENNVRNGVQLYLTDDSLISNNDISGNENGIALEDSNRNNISYNTIFENGATSEKRLAEYPGLRFSIQASTNGHGVFLDPSDNNVIQGNNIFGNSGNGIFLVDSDNTNILHNILSVNLQYGVNIDPNSLSTIVGTNDFFENNFEPGSQALDDGVESFFDHNYWSDWIGEGSYEIDGTAKNADDNPADNPNSWPGYEFTTPTIIYPNGGEGLDNTVAVQWENVFSEKGGTVQYWLFYSRDGGSSWVNIPMESYELITAADDTKRIQYMWDTTTVENGYDYLIKVVAVDQNGYSTFDTSDDVFAIKNEGEETTTTTETKTTTTGPQITPSWSYLIAAMGLALALGMKRRKQK
ncbi:MAG: right-handed parallel beta-helix repeat-containing protein [Candidatus Hodarchaeales archaeon]|jgi:parallel beta-helix repeat protein